VGADALTVEQSVATPIEQQMSGVDNMIYMYSINANNGQMTLRVDFDVGTDPSTEGAHPDRQSAVALPDEVSATGSPSRKSEDALVFSLLPGMRPVVHFHACRARRPPVACSGMGQFRFSAPTPPSVGKPPSAKLRLPLMGSPMPGDQNT
jgi:hypothetical protein